jgi:hypothetical protein
VTDYDRRIKGDRALDEMTCKICGSTLHREYAHAVNQPELPLAFAPDAFTRAFKKVTEE